MLLQSLLLPILTTSVVAQDFLHGAHGQEHDMPPNGMAGPDGLKGPHRGNMSEEAQCFEMWALSKFVAQSSNTTKVNVETNNNATQISEIQAKVSAASTKLASLKSNTTLANACDAMDSQIQMDAQCAEMDRLQRLVKFASNTTALDDKTQNNSTRVSEIQAKASAASTKLASMKSNTTLMSAWSAIWTEGQCVEMDMLQNIITLSSNTTLLNQKADNNATRVSELQAQATKAQSRLDNLKANSTLTSACSSITASLGAITGGVSTTTPTTATATGSSSSSTATTESSPSSAARHLAAEPGVILLSTIILAALAVLVL